ncbi:hypothetical protein B0H16DRAFT_1715452 [Mycena metata]|uniref:Uncharacterized protein n=1 Tax=Mycena metata TaxID=1033252 RepID=A0AAD7JQD4_9AGAR|nr:hypothetical protein B0H16DRAFT_1715452 [Mycena metata]
MDTAPHENQRFVSTNLPVFSSALALHLVGLQAARLTRFRDQERTLPSPLFFRSTRAHSWAPTVIPAYAYQQSPALPPPTQDHDHRRVALCDPAATRSSPFSPVSSAYGDPHDLVIAVSRPPPALTQCKAGGQTLEYVSWSWLRPGIPLSPNIFSSKRQDQITIISSLCPNLTRSMRCAGSITPYDTDLAAASCRLGSQIWIRLHVKRVRRINYTPYDEPSVGWGALLHRRIHRPLFSARREPQARGEVRIRSKLPLASPDRFYAPIQHRISCCLGVSPRTFTSAISKLKQPRRICMLTPEDPRELQRVAPPPLVLSSYPTASRHRVSRPSFSARMMGVSNSSPPTFPRTSFLATPLPTRAAPVLRFSRPHMPRLNYIQDVGELLDGNFRHYYLNLENIWESRQFTSIIIFVDVYLIPSRRVLSEGEWYRNFFVYRFETPPPYLSARGSTTPFLPANRTLLDYARSRRRLNHIQDVSELLDLNLTLSDVQFIRPTSCITRSTTWASVNSLLALLPPTLSGTSPSFHFRSGAAKYIFPSIRETLATNDLRLKFHRLHIMLSALLALISLHPPRSSQNDQRLVKRSAVNRHRRHLFRGPGTVVGGEEGQKKIESWDDSANVREDFQSPGYIPFDFLTCDIPLPD